MNYQEALEYLNTWGKFGIKPGLSRIKLLLEKIGNPQNDLRFVHVAGTNGKGSVTAMLASILLASGLKTGTFTSPHLVAWNERINICGEDVADEYLAEALTVVKDAVDSICEQELFPTQFEIITAAAFWLFKKYDLEIVVLEVGMGGLFDSTNIIVPDCTVITNIGLDHTDYLGETIEEIARQKAGIIKAGVPVVTAAESIALNVLVDKAASVKAPLYTYRIDFAVIGLNSSFVEQKFMFRKGDFMANYIIRLAGMHQMKNAGLAVMTAKLLQENYQKITEDSIREGLLRAKWPGRFELVGIAPDVILDGAHNLHSAIVLRESLDRYYLGQEICFVLGIMKDKQVEEVVQMLVHENDYLIATFADDSDRAADPEEIVKYTTAKNMVVPDLAEALSEAEKIAGEDGVICIAGSLYLVGKFKALKAKRILL